MLSIRSRENDVERTKNQLGFKVVFDIACLFKALIGYWDHPISIILEPNSSKVLFGLVWPHFDWTDSNYDSNDHENADSMLVEWRLIRIFLEFSSSNESCISEAPFKCKFVPQQNKVVASQSEKVSSCHSN